MRILIAEDNLLTRRMLERTVERWGYEYVSTPSGKEALDILLQPDPPLLAIVDWMMADVDGTTVCRTLRERLHEPYIYIILLTGKRTTQDIVAGLEAGADDYIVKPFNPEELRVRVRAGERIVRLHQELVAAREKLRIQALTDPLTQVWNHRAIIERLEKEHARAIREGTRLIVAMLDIDRFKRINDTYGHPVGDQVLIETASRIRDVLRPYDSVGRYGGEEFLIVVPAKNGANATTIGRRLWHRIRSSPFTVNDLELPVTTSIGLAVWSSDAPVDTRELVRRADQALYYVKRTSRDNYAVYSELADMCSAAEAMVPGVAGSAEDLLNRLQNS